MPKQKKEDVLRNQLLQIVLRRSCVKEFQKATEALEAALQQQMEQEGVQRLEGNEGSTAAFMTVTSYKMPSNPSQVLELLDARTMASLLAESSVTAEKQGLLERIYPGQNMRGKLVESPSRQFRINLPRSPEQVAAMQKLIEADQRKMEESVETLLRGYQATENKSARPTPPDFEEKMAAKKPRKNKKA